LCSDATYPRHCLRTPKSDAGRTLRNPRLSLATLLTQVALQHESLHPQSLQASDYSCQALQRSREISFVPPLWGDGKVQVLDDATKVVQRFEVYVRPQAALCTMTHRIDISSRHSKLSQPIG